MKKLFTTNQKGFSLVETLFAIAILMIALVGPMTLAWSSLSASSDQRNEVTASYLAQESLEYIKNLRDTLALSGKGATAFRTAVSNCMTNNGCDVPVVGNSNPIAPCQNLAGCPLYRITNNTTHDTFYTSDLTQANGSTPPPVVFTRKIVVTSPYNGHNDETLVAVSLSWKNHSITRHLDLDEVLYNLNGN